MKLVFPQSGLMPEQVADWQFRHFFIQPMDGPAQQETIEAAIRWRLTHPGWRLSLQTHKLTGMA